jgi:hypothetical protein
MKFLKYFGLGLGLIILILFLAFGVEYNAGHYASKTGSCKIANGHSEVYVHWFVPMNTTVSNFCDGNMTPVYYEAKGDCNCSK